MEMIYKHSRPEIERSVVRIIEESAAKILKTRKSLVFAVPGGRSVVGIFKLLKKTDLIDWEKIHIFILDERLVPIDDRESNFKLANELFIEELIQKNSIPGGNIHPFIYDKKISSMGIREYEDELKRFGGSYDIILLSSGEDGHIGGLYPGHHSIKDDSEYYIVMDDSPKPPPARMSSSRKLLLRSKTAIVLFLGEGKKPALKAFNDPDTDYISCPAKIINQIERSFALTDIMPVE